MSLPNKPSQEFMRVNPQIYGHHVNTQVPNAKPDASTALRMRRRKMNKTEANCTSNETHADNLLSNTESKCDEATTLDSPVSRKTKSIQRVTVCITGFRVRPLDPDNFAGSTKDIIDGLRHAQLIHGDAPWQIILETAQVRVATFAEEKTVIEIDNPDAWILCHE